MKYLCLFVCGTPLNKIYSEAEMRCLWERKRIKLKRPLRFSLVWGRQYREQPRRRHVRRVSLRIRFLAAQIRIFDIPEGLVIREWKKTKFGEEVNMVSSSERVQDMRTHRCNAIDRNEIAKSKKVIDYTNVAYGWDGRLQSLTNPC